MQFSLLFTTHFGNCSRPYRKFIKQGQIKLIKTDSTDIYNVTCKFYFK